ncbi:cAMP-binding domain of CRP or a regulatory subunit of cAMP-dependent protein kinases [Flavobacterium fryxellicola]|uniref:Cyclic nucleotide-binding protein n=1 Tax=Flavobacterium fryxellicola TaxID=249352 RepID=A0A167XBU3_9FLAO|nr:Crp/Fnr family transcriptional regulator [Flavobacterium fryxellicola]OAB28201.1 cyclic nucleotide-binding protein [Flavobacterium fryxellicola]SHN78081.1 cAMP-binding domain of CRP or a regulatory subunit of cAMP-dependent protein kinases [Flavobacterium fryxellicola]
MIQIEMLEKYDAVRRLYKKSEIIFEKDNFATHYYQIISGTVKMNNFNDEGREFVQGFFYEKQCFGEPPLFLERTYPANAEAVEDSELICVSKANFLKLIAENPAVSIIMIENLARRLHYKSVMAAEISTQDAEHRLLQLFDYSIAYFNFKKEQEGFHIDLTRQKMGDLTGLRVETVIRAIKTLEKKGELKIVNRKVYR